MKVLVSKSELAKFRRRVLRSYPRERIEMLWGKQISADEFHIHIFEQIPHKGTHNSVQYDNQGEVEISEQDAEEAGLQQLGTIHSHPDCHDAAPSEYDHDGAVAVGDLISGIALVATDRQTGQRRVRIRIWGPIQGVDLQPV